MLQHAQPPAAPMPRCEAMHRKSAGHNWAAVPCVVKFHAEVDPPLARVLGQCPPSPSPAVAGYRAQLRQQVRGVRWQYARS